MIPYKWPVATEIPRNPAVRFEIAIAMRTLLEDGDEQLRQRRAEIVSIRQGLAEIARNIDQLRHEAAALILSELRKYGYNPEEPRIPKGNPGPGRWTRVAADDDPNKSSDAAGPDIPFQKYGRGHHWVTRKIFNKRNFSGEVKSFFDDARSGPLADPRVNHNTEEHRAYNDAVDVLLDQFLEKNHITEEQMTLAQAGEFVQEVKNSSMPAIRNFVIKINREVLKYGFRYGPWRRRGGGDDE
jgi:DNA-binding phage protein